MGKAKEGQCQLSIQGGMVLLVPVRNGAQCGPSYTWFITWLQLTPVVTRSMESNTDPFCGWTMDPDMAINSIRHYS